MIAVLLIASGLAVSGAQESEPERLPRPLTATFLASIDELPSGKLGARASAEYWEIVRQGIGVVPELIELLDDATLTEERVCLVGGFYAVGDVAMSAISDIIINVPWLQMIPGLDDARIDEIGFGVYWEYVRESPINRRKLKKRIRRWFAEYAGSVQWEPMPDHPASGVYRVPDSHDDA